MISRATPSPLETHSESVNTVSQWCRACYGLIMENTYSAHAHSWCVRPATHLQTCKIHPILKMKHMTYKHITVFSDPLFVSGKYVTLNYYSLSTRVLPELRVITVDGDSLRYVKRVFKDKLHVFSRPQAGVE